MIRDPKEKRRFVRVDLSCKIVVYAPAKHEILTHTENIGEGGVKVVIDEKLETLSIVGLELYLAEEPIVCQGRVVWVLEQQNRFDTGIEFYDIKNPDDKIIKNFIEAI